MKIEESASVKSVERSKGGENWKREGVPLLFGTSLIEFQIMFTSDKLHRIPSSNCSQELFYFLSPCIYSSWVLYIHRANPYQVFKLGSQIMNYREIPSLICLRENFLLAFSMHPFFFEVQTSLWMNVLIYQTSGTKQQLKTFRHETTDSM